MSKEESPKQFPLEDRALRFAASVNAYVRVSSRDIPNIENGKQLVRASCSVGANYIETNEALSKKDFQMRIKIAKKEAKEARFWIRLTQPQESQREIRLQLESEATQLMNILGAILVKSR